MFNIGAFASSVLDSIDSVAKESLEESRVSATALRTRRKANALDTSSHSLHSEGTGVAATAPVVGVANEEVPSGMILGKEEQSTHSGRTQESYVVPSPPRSSHGSSHEPEGVIPPVKEASAPPPPLLLPPPISNSFKQSASAQQDVDTLKKLLKKKSQEIEKLNREVLELEEHTTSLKDEVQEAWNQYKQAQEKAAFREAELLDEVKQIQKAKFLEKQQSVAAITKLNEEISGLTKQLQAQEGEKMDLVTQIQSFDLVQAQWQERVAVLENQLEEARFNTIQGSQSLREELKAVQASAEQMRVDYALLLRQNQSRQTELETENANLNKAIADYQRELQRQKGEVGRSAVGAISENDHLALQKDIMTITVQLEKERERCAELDRRLKDREKETRALQILYDEEKKRNSESYNKVVARVQELEEEASRTAAQLARAHPGDASKESAAEKELSDLKLQVQHLSQLLLKRQSSILDLQAERSALKAKVSELEAQFRQAEQSLREIEDDGEPDYYTISVEEGMPVSRPDHSSSSGSRPLQRRGPSRQRNVDCVTQAQLFSDLEKIGVKPNAGVGQAVRIIDTYTLLTGSFLRNYPLVRLGFVLYLLILHLWVLFILVLHTHSLDVVDSPQDYINNAK
eukprot:gene4354-4775_t